MLRRSLVTFLLFVIPTLGFAQTKSSAPSIQGVWKVTEIVASGPTPSTNSSPQPGLYIFTKKHYSVVTVNGTQPRKKNDPLPDATKATDPEKLARYMEWQPFTAQSGTYEIKGSTLTRHPLVAKNVGVMGGDPITDEVKLEGKTLSLVSKPRPGGYGPQSETRTKLVRVE